MERIGNEPNRGRLHAERQTTFEESRHSRYFETAKDVGEPKSISRSNAGRKFQSASKTNRKTERDGKTLWLSKEKNGCPPNLQQSASSKQSTYGCEPKSDRLSRQRAWDRHWGGNRRRPRIRGGALQVPAGIINQKKRREKEEKAGTGLREKCAPIQPKCRKLAKKRESKRKPEKRKGRLENL